MEGYEERSVCLSDCLFDLRAPGSQHHRLQHLGGERQTSGSVKRERDVMKNTFSSSAFAQKVQPICD